MFVLVFTPSIRPFRLYEGWSVIRGLFMLQCEPHHQSHNKEGLLDRMVT